MTNHLAHFGVKRKSGRYPWGSGERPYQGDAQGGGSYSKKSKSMKEFSNEELKSSIERLKLEKEYRSLADEAMQKSLDRLKMSREITELSSEQKRISHKRVMEALDTAGKAVSVGAGAMTLVRSFKNFNLETSERLANIEIRKQSASKISAEISKILSDAEKNSAEAYYTRHYKKDEPNSKKDKKKDD